jgi:lysophospholipase L1-like esterase
VKSNYSWVALWLCVACLGAQEKSPSMRFEKEIVAYEAADAKAMPPEQAVLFSGASGIRLWKSLATDFSEFQVINRGFGGSQIADCTYYADRVILPYKPQLIVFQAGGNDLNAGKSPEQILADFKTFVAKVHTALPDVKIVYMSIQPSPARWSQAEKQIKTNALIAKYSEIEKNITYVNAWNAFLNAEGQPRDELFVADKLHHNNAGYAVRTSLIKPVLEKLVPSK